MAMTMPKLGADTGRSQAKTISQAFEGVFMEHWPRVFGFLYRLVGDRDEAEDLALETFLRLYQRPPADGEDLNLGGWLHRVAANLGLNAIRGWKRRSHYELGAGKDAIFDAPSDAPADLFAAEEERQRVRQVLGEMNPRQARLLVLRYSGMAYREISSVLGVSAASIGPLLLRAEVEFARRYRLANPEEEV